MQKNFLVFFLLMVDHVGQVKDQSAQQRTIIMMQLIIAMMIIIAMIVVMTAKIVLKKKVNKKEKEKVLRDNTSSNQNTFLIWYCPVEGNQLKKMINIRNQRCLKFDGNY